MKENLVFFSMVEGEMNQREESLEIQTWQINLWSEVEALGTQMPRQKHKVKYSAAVFPFWFKSLVYIF